MTEEEARAEQEEAKRLIAEINGLKNKMNRVTGENQIFQTELETLTRTIELLARDINKMDEEVNQSMKYVQNKIQIADADTTELLALINELTKSYFVFKNLGAASKNITQFTDEYYTKFRYFNELRRVSLGYVIGLDSHICSDETVRKKVEQVYLQNTEYWLAYAIMAIMLWADDNKEAAEKAVSKALAMDFSSASLFFLLVNLRFTRVDAAKKWYISYLNHADMESLDIEWKYLLQAYLAGIFGADREFNQMVNRSFMDMLKQMECMHPNYGKKVAEKTNSYFKVYIHITENEFETLRRICPDYKEIKELLSLAEKNELFAMQLKKILENEIICDSHMFQRIENILYNLINAYDKEELKVIKNKKYNELIVKAKGDIRLAKQFFNIEFPSEKKTHSLDELLFDWAFEEDMTQIDVTVKRFALIHLKQWIVKGISAYREQYKEKEKEKYRISIDGWEAECDENSYEKEKQNLERHYNRNRAYNIMKDGYVQIFIAMMIVSVAMLMITSYKFNKISLVIGILLGVAGGFLLWRRIVDMQAVLRKKCEKGCILLGKALDELKAWRKIYQTEDAKNSDLIDVFNNIEI